LQRHCDQKKQSRMLFFAVALGVCLIDTRMAVGSNVNDSDTAIAVGFCDVAQAPLRDE